MKLINNYELIIINASDSIQSDHNQFQGEGVETEQSLIPTLFYDALTKISLSSFSNLLNPPFNVKEIVEK